MKIGRIYYIQAGQKVNIKTTIRYCCTFQLDSVACRRGFMLPLRIGIDRNRLETG